MISIVYTAVALIYVHNYAIREKHVFKWFVAFSMIVLIHEVAVLETLSEHYQNSFKRATTPPKHNSMRDYKLVGPISMDALPVSVKKEFMLHGMGPPWRYVNFKSPGTVNLSVQIPAVMIEYISDIKKGVWLKEMIDLTVSDIKNGEDVSPGAYPSSALQIKDAVEKVGAIGHRVLIAGSISPWVESVLIASDIAFSAIDTTDYNKIEIMDDRITFVAIDQVIDNVYDMVISYSSIEHDGLGRYGDPINPHGDIAAVTEYHRYLKTGGYFLLGLPVTKEQSGYIHGNAHRIYSNERIEFLKNIGFTEIDRVWPSTSGPKDWQNQPVMIWQKD
jgi:hypothetical protein